MVDYIFLEEAKRQCKFSLMAVENLKRGLESDDSDLFWFSVHGFLSAAGNLSKLLLRAKSLSKTIGIDDGHIIFNRKLRNHWEHFDERIEKWGSDASNRIFVDSNIGPSSKLSIFQQASPFRNFETDTRSLTFAGDRIDIQELIDAIYKIKVKLDNTRAN